LRTGRSGREPGSDQAAGVRVPVRPGGPVDWPAAWMAAVSAVIRAIALASSPESVGYRIFAGITAVSARTLPVLSTLAATARCNSARFSSSHDPRPAPGGDLLRGGRMRHPGPQRDPAEPHPADRVGDLAAQRLIAQPVAVLQEHHPQVGLDRDRRPAAEPREVRLIRAKNAGSSSSASAAASAAGSCWYSGGSIGSHRVWAKFLVTSICTGIPSITGVSVHDLVIRSAAVGGAPTFPQVRPTILPDFGGK
jgi:hypothetical protein